jgi:hypothetical protein
MGRPSERFAVIGGAPISPRVVGQVRGMTRFRTDRPEPSTIAKRTSSLSLQTPMAEGQP